MLVFEHPVQNFIIERVLHWVLREFVENVSLDKRSGVGLSVVLDGVIPQGTRYFQRLQQGFYGCPRFALEVR